MVAYVVGLFTVHSTDWRPAYVKKTGELIQKYGGRALSRFGAPLEELEGNGNPPTTVNIFEFPSIEQARAFHSDPDYAPMIKLRQSGTDSQLLLIDATLDVVTSMVPAEK